MQTDLKLQDMPIDSLITEGKYARLTKYLSDLLTTVEPADQSTLNSLTATALQICMFCQQCQMEMEWHRQADHEARLRLSELNLQLDTLLSSILEYDPQTESQCPAVSVSLTLLEDQAKQEVSDHPNLWQRIRNLFNFITRFPDSRQLMAKVVVNTQSPSTGKKGKRATTLENSGKIRQPKLGTQADQFDSSTTPTMKGPDILLDVESGDMGKTAATSTPSRVRKDASVIPNEETVPFQDSSPSLVVYCLGTFRVFLNEQLVDEWVSSKGKSIFKYLIMHHEQKVDKDILMDLFWPESSPDNARNNLNVAIHGLRKSFRAVSEIDVVTLEEGAYQLNSQIKVWTDIDLFESHLQTANRLNAEGHLDQAIKEMEFAVNLYQGDFFPNDRYEDWTILTRERLRLSYLNILDSLSQISFSKEDYSRSAMLCQMILDHDSCREDTHRRLIRCYSHQGQRHLALRQFQLCEKALHNELDIEPDPATIQLVECIREQEECLD